MRSARKSCSAASTIILAIAVGGDVQCLRILGAKYGFHVNAMPAVTVDGDVVSSTLIRGLIMAGEMDECSKFLGRNYDIGGEVVVGNQLGQKVSVSDLQYHD